MHTGSRMGQYILLKNPIWVFAWDYMGLYGNPWECIGNNGISHRNLCESAWGKFSIGWHAKQCMGWNSVHRNLQGTCWPFHKGNRVGRWVNYTYTGWRCTHVVQHVKKLPTSSLMKEMIWDCMWWNSSHRNPQGIPCGRYGWIKFYTGSHVEYVTFP